MSVSGDGSLGRGPWLLAAFQVGLQPAHSIPIWPTNCYSRGLCLVLRPEMERISNSNPHLTWNLRGWPLRALSRRRG